MAISRAGNPGCSSKASQFRKATLNSSHFLGTNPKQLSRQCFVRNIANTTSYSINHIAIALALEDPALVFGVIME